MQPILYDSSFPCNIFLQSRSKKEKARDNLLQLHPVYEQISISPRVVIFFFPCDLSRAETQKRISSGKLGGRGDLVEKSVLWKPGTMFGSSSLSNVTIVVHVRQWYSRFLEYNPTAAALFFRIRFAPSPLIYNRDSIICQEEEEEEDRLLALPLPIDVALSSYRGAVIGTRTSVVQHSSVLVCILDCEFPAFPRINQALLGYFWKRGKYSGSLLALSKYES